jgi:hypothetical protein
MTAYKELSEFYSEDKTRTATVRLVLDTREFTVSVTNESGHAFVARFPTEDDAEQFAEEWVSK